MQCALEASNLIYLLLRRIPKEFDIKSEIKKRTGKLGTRVWWKMGRAVLQGKGVEYANAET